MRAYIEVRAVSYGLAIGLGILLTAQMARAATESERTPPDIAAGATLREMLLFPSPSELVTGLKANGIKLAPVPNLGGKVPAPDWAKLAPRTRQFQLGAVLGYLAFAAATGDMQTIAKCLDGVLAAGEAMGIPKTSRSFTSIAEMRQKILDKRISDVKVLAALDELRREALFDIANRLSPTDVQCILAAGWLRGGALIVAQAKSDGDAERLGEFVVRPELIGTIAKISESTGADRSPERSAAVNKMLEIAKKKKVSRADLNSYAALVETVLKPQAVVK